MNKQPLLNECTTLVLWVLSEEGFYCSHKIGYILTINALTKWPRSFCLILLHLSVIQGICFLLWWSELNLNWIWYMCQVCCSLPYQVLLKGHNQYLEKEIMYIRCKELTSNLLSNQYASSILMSYCNCGVEPLELNSCTPIHSPKQWVGQACVYASFGRPIS